MTQPGDDNRFQVCGVWTAGRRRVLEAHGQRCRAGPALGQHLRQEQIAPAPAQISGPTRPTITARRIPGTPRSAATERCAEIGARRNRGTMRFAHAPGADERPHAQRLALLGKLAPGESPRMLCDQRQGGGEFTARVRGMSTLKQIQLGGEGILFGAGTRRAGRIGCGRALHIRRGRLARWGADSRCGSVLHRGQISGEIPRGACALRPWSAATAPTAAQATATDTASAIRNRPCPGETDVVAGASGGRGGAGEGTAPGRRTARARASARARISAGTRRWSVRCSRKASSSGSRSASRRFISARPPSTAGARRPPAPCDPCRASRRRRTS